MPTEGNQRRRDGRSIGRRDVTRWTTPVGRVAASAHTTLSRAIGPRRALLGSLIVGGAITGVAAMLAARTYDAVTGDDGIAALDRPALTAAERLRSPAVDGIAAGIAYLFGPVGMPVLTLVAAIAISVRRREVSPFILTSAAGAGSLFLTVRDKKLVGRNRPPRADAIPPYEISPSFPSGHTLNATAITGTLAYLLALRERRTAPQVGAFAAAAAVAGVVGLSRVLLGAHWLTDVTFGWCAGIGWVSTIVTSDRLYLTSVDRIRHERS